MHFYVIYVMIWLATKLFHRPRTPATLYLKKKDRQKNRSKIKLHQSMRRRQRLNITVQKYAPKWYAILKLTHDLELAHDVGPTHDMSLTYMPGMRSKCVKKTCIFSYTLIIIPYHALCILRIKIHFLAT